MLATNVDYIYNHNHKVYNENNISSQRRFALCQTNDSVKVEITDDSEPLKLYRLKMDEAEFEHVKNNQKLTLQYSHLRNKLIELLEETKKTNSNMYITIEENEFHCVLTFKERSVFKHLIYLSLTFQAGKKEEIEQKVTTMIRTLQDDLRNTAIALENERELKSNLQQKLLQKNNELEGIKESYSKRFEDLQKECSVQMENLSLQHKLELEKMEHRNLENNGNLKLKVDELAQTINSQNDARNLLGKDNKILKARLQEFQDKLHVEKTENEKNNKDLQTLRVRLCLQEEINRKVVSEKDALSRHLETLQTSETFARKRLEKLHEYIKECTAAKQTIEVQCYEMEKNCRKVSEELASVSMDLKKANDIIHNLQTVITKEEKQTSELQNMLRKRDEHEAGLRAKYVEIQKRADSLQRKTQKDISEISKRELEIEKLKLENETLQKKVGILCEELDETKKDLAQYKPRLEATENIDKYYYKKFSEESRNFGSPSLLPIDVLSQTEKQRQK